MGSTEKNARYLNSHPGLARKGKDMSQIEKLNQKIREMVTEGYTPDEAICDLALTAGLENFNPFRATEPELELIASNL